MIRFYNREVVEQQSVVQEEWWESEEQMEARFFKNEIKKMVRGPFVSIFLDFLFHVYQLLILPVSAVFGFKKNN